MSQIGTWSRLFLLKNTQAVMCKNREDRCCMLYVCRYVNERRQVVKEGTVQVYEWEYYTAC